MGGILAEANSIKQSLIGKYMPFVRRHEKGGTAYSYGTVDRVIFSIETLKPIKIFSHEMQGTLDKSGDFIWRT
jgi:hypothetical protein